MALRAFWHRTVDIWSSSGSCYEIHNQLYTKFASTVPVSCRYLCMDLKHGRDKVGCHKASSIPYAEPNAHYWHPLVRLHQKMNKYPEFRTSAHRCSHQPTTALSFRSREENGFTCACSPKLHLAVNTQCGLSLIHI